MVDRGTALGALTAVVVAAVLSIAACASAQDEPVDAVAVVPPCPQLLSTPRFRSLLRLELSLAGVEHVDFLELDENATLPRIDRSIVLQLIAHGCRDDGFELSVWGRADDGSVLRETLDLTAVPERTRARALALAIAQRVRVEQLLREPPVLEEAAELLIEEVAEPPPRIAAAALGTPRAVGASPRVRRTLARPRARRSVAETFEPDDDPPRRPLSAQTRLWLAGQLRAFPDVTNLVFGGRVGAVVRIEQTGPLRLGFDAGVDYGAESFTVGRIETLDVTGGVSIGVAWQIVDEFAFVPAARLEIGYVRLDGSVATGSVGQVAEGLAMTAAGTLRAELWVDSLAIFLDFDVGAVLVGAVATAASLDSSGMRGVLLGWRLGLGFDP